MFKLKGMNSLVLLMCNLIRVITHYSLSLAKLRNNNNLSNKRDFQFELKNLNIQVNRRRLFKKLTIHLCFLYLRLFPQMKKVLLSIYR